MTLVILFWGKTLGIWVNMKLMTTWKAGTSGLANCSADRGGWAVAGVLICGLLAI